MKYGVVRALAFFGGAVLTLSAILVVLGVVVGLVRDSDVRESVGWALAVGGVLVALLVGGSGSTTVNYRGSRDVVGSGHFIGARIPLPQTPLVWALVGFVCAAIGILILLV